MRELQASARDPILEPTLIEPPSGTLRVLVIDGSVEDRKTVREALHLAGTASYEVLESPTAAEALAQLPDSQPDAVIFDYPPPDQGDGVLLEELSRRAPDAALLVLASHGDEKTAVGAMKAGASDYLVKEQALRAPMHLDWAIYMAVYTKRLARENLRLVQALRARNEELETLNKRLWELSLIDELTGFFNRRYISSRLEEEISRCARYHIPLSLVLMDLDHFKEVNDHFGHLEGDRVLRETAGRVQKSLRDTDLAGRFGGEEFLLILTNTEIHGAASFCNRIREQLEQHTFTRPGGEIRVTGSFGVASYGPGCTSAAELLHTADQNLYLAKGQGRNRVVAGPAPTP
jgi:diguanylate cyclase (GGDEF)-like protein